MACNKFSVLELSIMWIFRRVVGNTFPLYCYFGANNWTFHPYRLINAEYLLRKIMIVVSTNISSYFTLRNIHITLASVDSNYNFTLENHGNTLQGSTVES